MNQMPLTEKYINARDQANGWRVSDDEDIIYLTHRGKVVALWSAVAPVLTPTVLSKQVWESIEDYEKLSRANSVVEVIRGG